MREHIRMRNGVLYDDSGDRLVVRYDVSPEPFSIVNHHMHTTYEVQIAVSGHTLVENGTNAVELHGPYVVVHRPYMPHRMRMLDCTKPYSRFVLNFKQEFLDRAAEWVPHIGTLFTHSFFAFELREEHIRTILPHLEDMLRLRVEERNGACELAVAIALDDIACRLGECRIVAAGAELKYLDRVIRYIIENLSQRLVCEEVACQFYVSESKLGQDFKRCFGLSFNQYIMQLRVKTAKELLASGSSGASAAKACGFCNPSYFIRVFKSFTGQTPSEYIRKIRDGTDNG